jgi:hypothetical protein
MTALHAVLGAVADPLEAASDAMGDALVRGETPLRDKEGLPRYLQMRTRLALLRLKQERMGPGGMR